MLLDECLFEDWAEVRPNEAKVYDLIDNGILDWETVGGAALSWISDDDVGELARQCSWFNDLDEAIISKKGKEKLKQNLKESVHADDIRNLVMKNISNSEAPINKDDFGTARERLLAEYPELHEDDEALEQAIEIYFDVLEDMDYFNNNNEENLSESVSKDTQEVVNPVMADAIRDQEKAEKIKEQAIEITKDGKPTIKNESFDVYNALDALNVFNENLKKTK